MHKILFEEYIYGFVCVDIAEICIFINQYLCKIAVVPSVGTWIEIFVNGFSTHSKTVVPSVGTWIEITVDTIGNLMKEGRSQCGNVD